MKSKRSRVFLGRNDDGDRVWAEIEIRPIYQSHQRSHYWKQTVNHKIVPLDAVEISVTFDLISYRCREVTACGASRDEFRRITKPAKGLTVGEIHRLADLGDKWHLNGMQAGCVHQTVVWEDHKYGRRPSLELTPACPLTGYKYGHAWLSEIVPSNVIAELEAFMAKGEPTRAFDF